MRYPLILNGDHAEFEAEHANTPPHERADWPLPSFDARDWASAWTFGWLLGWPLMLFITFGAVMVMVAIVIGLCWAGWTWLETIAHWRERRRKAR